MMEVVIIGGGGHAKAVAALLREDTRWHIAGCIAREAAEVTVDLPYLGNDDILSTLAGKGISHVAVAVGDNRLREKLANKVHAAGLQCASIHSRHAIIAPSARIGPGSVVMEGAIIKADACIGDLAIINTHATIEHDTKLGHCVHVAPAAVTTGHVQVGDGSLIGAGAIILPGIKVGHGCTVGAGSVVTRHLPDGATCYGNPARIHAPTTEGEKS